LAYVVEQGATTQTVLAERLGVGRAAAGSAVDRLEQRGLVERRSDRDDRRVWLIAPTDEGKELAAKVADIDISIRRALRLGIDRHERQMLASLLVRLQRNLLAIEHGSVANNRSTTNGRQTT
jgi:MarR family transcriptional regulator, transcriptional regulator for hemolysin